MSPLIRAYSITTSANNGDNMARMILAIVSITRTIGCMMHIYSNAKTFFILVGVKVNQLFEESEQ